MQIELYIGLSNKFHTYYDTIKSQETILNANNIK